MARTLGRGALASLVGALALLNASLAFHNIWPTPAIAWFGELSLEFALVLLVLAAASRWLGSTSPAIPLVRLLTILWIVLVVGHYADVTTPALYGRDINLYFDLRFMPDVAAMVIRAAPAWLIALAAGAIVLVAAVLYITFRWALRQVVLGMADSRARRAMTVFAILVVGVYVAQRTSERLANSPLVVFATPVTATYVQQARLILDARAETRSLPPSPPMDADLARVGGADVFLIFIEAYGAVAYERPDIAPHLAASRAALDAAIHANQQEAVSAFVESPTFGGSSWLAHISLMSGVEVRDAASNASLMAQSRETVVTSFKRRGYRTIALMPGLRQRWPEGGFYGFDDIYGAPRLDYRGPEFGWFAIPDEFSLARFDVLEPPAARAAPLFVFYPTISTHFPFSPTPPYQPDWPRMLTDRPYDGPAIVKAYAREPDWTSFSQGYVDAVSYTYATLGGYLTANADRDRIYILLGDHQPAAAVSGEHASWDVPVHIIASVAPGRSRSAVLERLKARGFGSGLTPTRPPLGRMHTLLPLLLDAFSNDAR